MKIESINNNLYILIDGKLKDTGLIDSRANRELLISDVIPKIQNLTIEYFSKIYLSQKKHLKTYQEIKNLVNRYILPRWGAYRVNSIKLYDVKEWIYKLSESMSFKTVRKYITPLSGILDVAVEYEIIYKNPIKDISIPTHKILDINPFTQSEVNKILHSSDGWFKNYLAISFFTGARGGEIIALKKSDIDFKNNLINIDKSISNGLITTPKTQSSIRVIPMFKALIPYLIEQIELTQSSFLFHPSNENHFRTCNAVRGDTKQGRWVRLLNYCNIEYRKIYTTRHTFITQMLNSGKFKIMDIAKIVGHSNTQMIFTNYAKFIKAEHLKIDKDFDLYS
jgi:integrase